MKKITFYKQIIKMNDVILIKKYCNTRKLKILDELSPASAVLFQKLCVYTLTQQNGKHDIAQEVLKHFGLDMNGKRVGLKDRGRKKVEGHVGKLSVALTGARDGDVLVGASKGANGAVMRIHKGDVPPQKRTLDGVRYYPDLWDKFLIKLGSVPFFTNMDVATREVWLEIHEADNENSIGQEGARIELIQPGTGLFVEKLSAS